jgi:hypothetical protein
MKAVLVLALGFAAVAFGEGHECQTAEGCQEILRSHPTSSLAHFRLGEVFLVRKDLQSAAIEFDRALKGDLEPGWIVVWAHLNLGKIFDIAGPQRDRAVKQYRLAVQTRDNTRGALDQAKKYLESPYEGRELK